MPFFLVGRSRDDLSLTLLSTEVFDTRDHAARAVQSVALSGGIDVNAVDVYIADLGAAAPVVLVGLPSAAPAIDGAAAGVWEAPETDADEDVSTDAAIGEVAAEVDSLGAGEALTAALERATSSMAAEGIVPPESVGFTVMSDQELAPMPPILGDDEPLIETVAALATEDPAPAIESEPEAEPEPEPEPVSAIFEDEEVIEVPVVEAPAVEIAEPEETTPEPVAPADIADDLSAVIASLSYTGEPALVEPAPADVEEAGNVTEPAGDDGTWPWLNVGEVDPGAAVEPEFEVPTEPASITVPESEAEVVAESEFVVEPVVTPEPEMTPEPEVVPVVEAEPVLLADDSLIANVATDEESFAPQPVIMGDYPDSPGIPEAPTTVYEPAGDLSLADYTCADCIYSNTCPKVNESTPAECGSFQWKAL